MNHRLLSASSAHIWCECPGFVAMSALVPETDKWKKETDEGHAAHWVCEQIEEDCINNGAYLTSPDTFVGQAAPNGVIVTADMAAGAKMYVEEIDAIVVDDCWRGVMVERTVQSTVHPECGGTLDTGYYSASAHTLHIFDYKFGHGDVDVFENKQLLIYFDGLSRELAESGVDLTTMTVHFHIIQPRCFTASGPVKEWIVSAVDLRGLINRISSAAHAAMSPDAQTVSGTHCKHCPVRHECKSARQAALAGVEYTNTATPEPLSDDGLSYEMMELENAASAIKYRLEAIQDEAQSRIAAGRKIPHYVVKHGAGKRKWSVPLEDLKATAELLKVDFVKDPEPVTPAEAERRLKLAGMSLKDAKASLEGLFDTPSSGLKIVRDDGTEARRIFSK